MLSNATEFSSPENVQSHEAELSAAREGVKELAQDPRTAQFVAENLPTAPASHDSHKA